MPGEARQFKDSIYGQFARVGKALSDPRRLELLDVLCQGPRTVDALAAQIGQSPANTSHHLRALHAAGLLQSEKAGTFVTYRVAGDDVCALFDSLRALAEDRLAEVERVTRLFYDERDSMEPIGTEALVGRMQSGAVTLLDVRPPEEYEAGHVPGAISVPLEELERRMDELPRDHTLVAYCRGPYCVLALEAVERLRSRGFDAVRLEGSVRDWAAQGHAIEMSRKAV